MRGVCGVRCCEEKKERAQGGGRLPSVFVAVYVIEMLPSVFGFLLLVVTMGGVCGV